MIIFLDLETSGLDSSKHEILSIGAVKEDGTTFEVKVHPMNIKDADPVALQINGYNRKDWEEAFLLPNALRLLSEFAKGENMMAYNVSFDRSFLEKAYKDCNMVYPFHYHHYDMLSIAWFTLPGLPSYSLKNVCKHLGIDPEPAIHDALTGAQKAFEVYKKLSTGSLNKDTRYN